MPEVGCADGQREAFRDLARYPVIAGCAGGFTVPGVHRDRGPQCARAAGDDGARPNGEGCAATDLCAAGWHVCVSAGDVASHSPNGCNGVSDAATPSFFATRQSGPGCLQCATGTYPGCDGANCRADCADNNYTTNDLFGCGTLGYSPLPASCGVLNVSSHNTCTSLTTPWNCRSPESSGYDEALVVTKPGPGAGGVVCCRDS